MPVGSGALLVAHPLPFIAAFSMSFLVNLTCFYAIQYTSSLTFKVCVCVRVCVRERESHFFTPDLQCLMFECVLSVCCSWPTPASSVLRASVMVVVMVVVGSICDMV